MNKPTLLCFPMVLLFFLVSCLRNETNGQDRAAKFAGSFYPGSPQQLENMLTGFFDNVSYKQKENNLQAIVVPHAGYVYSGQTAAEAYSCIPKGADYKNVFLIGPSHRTHFEGASVYTVGDYQTPLGKVKVNQILAKEIADKNPVFTFQNSMHSNEHCLELQLPFLQTIFEEKLQIVPIIIGTQNPKTIQKIADSLHPWFSSENLFVISSDFSHYPPSDIATKADVATADAFCTGNPKKFLAAIKNNEYKFASDLATSCCGEAGLLTLLYLSENKGGMEFRKVAYTNSGENPQYGDLTRSVGYWAISISRKEKQDNKESFLSPDDKPELLKIARETLEEYLRTNVIHDYNTDKFSAALKTEAGAFVSLYKKDHELRGCIGRFNATGPLYRTVQEMAIAAATQDHRFLPVNPGELNNLNIEISVLTPLKKISSEKEIELGKHGIYIKKGYYSGTFLPQVAESTGWNLEEFLGHCSRDKAGIGWDGWKDAELFTYEAIVFGENDKK